MIWLNIEMPLCEVSHQIQNTKWQLPGQRDKGLLFLNKSFFIFLKIKTEVFIIPRR